MASVFQHAQQAFFKKGSTIMILPGNVNDITPKQELYQRISAIVKHIHSRGLDGAFVLQNTDVYYFSGTAQQAVLYIPAVGDPILMVRKSFERAKAESLLDRIVVFQTNRQIPSILTQNGYPIPVKIGMELDVIPVNLFFNFQEIFPNSSIEDISHEIRLVRAIKSEYEINKIRQAAALSDILAAHAKHIIREGMPEIEAAGKLEAEARRLGHQGIVRMRLWGAELFYGHFMSGDSAAIPSYLSSPTGGLGISTAISQGPSARPIRKYEPILVDYTFAYKGYVSDHTRIFCIGGLSDDLIAAHRAMCDVQALIKKSAKPGVLSGDLYELAIQKVHEMNYGEWFMGVGDDRIRFIGHGVGIELDEYPFLAKGQKMKLEKNMTIAVEPKLIFPGRGVVGIENTHLVTDDGLEQLGTFEEQVIVI